MKKVSLLLLSLCLFVSACKDKNAPKSPEEVKEAAIEVVQNFIEDIYNDDLDVDDYCTTIFNLSSNIEIEHEYPIPHKISHAVRETGIKLDPAKVSLNKDVKEIRENGKLKYALVEIKYEGHKYGFFVKFNGDGKTGTEGEAIIFSTKGLVPFDNTKYAKKSGFTLECNDDEFGDMTPFLCLAGAVESSRVVKNKKKVSPLIVTVKRDLDEVFCSDSLVYTVKNNRIIKISKKKMNQQAIEKLMEIKKLYEAGILTKEEMEAEKNKVLHPEGIVSEEPKAEEPVSEEIPSDATPVMTDSEGRFVFDAPKQEPKQTNSSSTQQTGNSNKTLYWIGGIGIFAFIIVLLAMSGNKNNEPTYYSEEAAEIVTDSVSYDEPVTIINDEDTEIEETETGIWAGRIVVDGGMYRNCMTSAAISLVSDGNNRYHGTIKIHAGEGLNGYLEGDIIASGSDTELTIHIIEPYVAPGDNGNVFDEPEFYKPIQKNSDIFRITKQGNSYSAKPLGNMKEYFDGIADEITVNKK